MIKLTQKTKKIRNSLSWVILTLVLISSSMVARCLDDVKLFSAHVLADQLMRIEFEEYCNQWSAGVERGALVQASYRLR